MIDVQLTKHAQVRIRQRGIKAIDLNFIVEHGTYTGDGYIMLRQDVARLELETKRLVQKAHKLVNKRVIADGIKIITAFHATKSQQRAALKR
jgi:esterase/lipase superfamily enzyme